MSGTPLPLPRTKRQANGLDWCAPAIIALACGLVEFVLHRYVFPDVRWLHVRWHTLTIPFEVNVDVLLLFFSVPSSLLVRLVSKAPAHIAAAACFFVLPAMLAVLDKWLDPTILNYGWREPLFFLRKRRHRIRDHRMRGRRDSRRWPLEWNAPRPQRLDSRGYRAGFVFRSACTYPGKSCWEVPVISSCVTLVPARFRAGPALSRHGARVGGRIFATRRECRRAGTSISPRASIHDRTRSGARMPGSCIDSDFPCTRPTSPGIEHETVREPSSARGRSMLPLAAAMATPPRRHPRR